MNVSKVWVDNEYVHILTDGEQELRERIADFPVCGRPRPRRCRIMRPTATVSVGAHWTRISASSTSCR